MNFPWNYYEIYPEIKNNSLSFRNNWYNKVEALIL